MERWFHGAGKWYCAMNCNVKNGWKTVFYILCFYGWFQTYLEEIQILLVHFFIGFSKWALNSDFNKREKCWQSLSDQMSQWKLSIQFINPGNLTKSLHKLVKLACVRQSCTLTESLAIYDLSLKSFPDLISFFFSWLLVNGSTDPGVEWRLWDVFCMSHNWYCSSIYRMNCDSPGQIYAGHVTQCLPAKHQPKKVVVNNFMSRQHGDRSPSFSCTGFQSSSSQWEMY